MRRVFTGLMLGVPVLGLIYGLSVCQARPHHRDLSQLAGDLPVLIHYQPRDGATRAGEIRSAMHLADIQPR
ncbi:MAG: hypothetical protein ACXU8U_02960 [Asticcacaulis sp.]